MAAIEEINGRPAASVVWMVENGIISMSNIKILLNRHDAEQARRACKGQTALVYADNMPTRFKSKIIDMVGDIYEAMKTSLLDVQHDARAAQFYDAYTTRDGKRLPSEKRREYYATACVLNAITEFVNVRKGKRTAMGARAGKAWDTIVSNLEKVDRNNFPFSLPDNTRSLERKWRRYVEDGYDSLVHKAYVNDQRNAAKVSEDVQQKALTEFLTVQNWDNEDVARYYNSLARQNGWKEITAATVANFKAYHKTEIYAARHGKNAFRNELTMQVKRSRPSAPLLYWTRDGWKVELYYRTEENNYNSLTLEVILDTYCDYPVGYAIADREGVELISEAMRNAVKHTEELFGHMYRVHQLQSDNYGKAGMKEIDEYISKHFTPAAVGNAKAKVVEPYFKHLNKTYCSKQKNWSGYGVTSGKDLQPNPDLVKVRNKEFPTREECVSQIEEMIRIERESKRDKMLEGFRQMKQEHLVEMNARDYLTLWGEETKTRALLRGPGLVITINGVKRTYDCFDSSMRRHPSERWAVKYDPRDISRALAISEDGRLVYELEEKYEQPMALADRRPGDAEQLQRIRDFNEKLMADAIEFVSDASGTVKSLMSSRKLEDGTNPSIIDGAEHLQKMVLTDKHGRHKDALNDIRCGKSEVKQAKATEETEDDNEFLNDY